MLVFSSFGWWRLSIARASNEPRPWRLLQVSTVWTLALCVNPGCWPEPEYVRVCCGAPSSRDLEAHLPAEVTEASPEGGQCWPKGQEVHGRKECCELGGYLLDRELLHALPLKFPRWLQWPRSAESDSCIGDASTRFFISSDYQLNLAPVEFVDTEDHAGQAPVYGLALHLAKQLDLDRVVELGGGGGEWSRQLLYQGLEVVLVDRPGSANLARATSRLGSLSGWDAVSWDVDKDQAFPTLPDSLSPSSPGIAIAADIIEHLVDPRGLLYFLSQLLTSGRVRVVLLSTPDRDAYHDRRYHHGPPQNKAHVREWKSHEFASMLLCEKGLPLGGLFEVEGSLIAVIGLAPEFAPMMAHGVWSSPEMVKQVKLRWRHLL